MYVCDTTLGISDDLLRESLLRVSRHHDCHLRGCRQRIHLSVNRHHDCLRRRNCHHDCLRYGCLKIRLSANCPLSRDCLRKRNLRANRC